MGDDVNQILCLLFDTLGRSKMEHRTPQNTTEHSYFKLLLARVPVAKSDEDPPNEERHYLCCHIVYTLAV